MDAFTEKVLLAIVGAVLGALTLWAARGNRSAEARKKDADADKTVSETMQNVLIAMNEQAEQTRELRLEVDDLHKQSAAKDTKISGLEKEVTDLREEVGDLRSQVTTKDSHIVARDRKIEVLEGKVKELETEAIDLRLELATVKAENADLKARFESGEAFPKPN